MKSASSSVIGINVILAVSLNMDQRPFAGRSASAMAHSLAQEHYATALTMVGVGSVPLANLRGHRHRSLLGIVVGFASLRVRTDFLAVTTDRRELPVHRLRAQAGFGWAAKWESAMFPPQALAPQAT